MNKYIAVSSILLVATILPGMALAEKGDVDGVPLVHTDAVIGGQLRINDDGREASEEGIRASASSSVEWGKGRSATSTLSSRGEKRGLLKKFGTTTPPGILRSHLKEATTTTENDGTKGGGGKGVLSGFWQWLMGAPATTTLGDIRAHIEASTTASTTVSAGSHGFLARLFGFFHF